MRILRPQVYGYHSVSSLFVILRTPNRCYMGRTTVISCDIHLDLLAGIGLQDRQADGYESLPKGVQGRHMPFRFYILSQPISRPRGVSSTPYLTWRRIHATTGGNSDSPRISAPAILQKPVSSLTQVMLRTYHNITLVLGQGVLVTSPHHRERTYHRL